PSMMTATCRGTRPPEIGEIRSPRCSAGDAVTALASLAASAAGRSGVCLNFKELRLFLSALVVNCRDVAVRHLLQLVLITLEVILRNAAFLFSLSQLVVRVAAHVP